MTGAGSALTVPIPTMSYDAVLPGLAALEQPLTLAVGAVTQHGAALGPAQLAAFGLTTVRRVAAGSSAEVWDAEQLRWVPDPGTGLPAAALTPLAHRDGDPNPWWALLVAAGGKDADGQPQFAKAAGGYPHYRFRASFTTREGATGSSAPSEPVSFTGVADRNLVVLGAGDDEEPPAATLARVVLRNPALQTIGQLQVERAGLSARVTASNSAGAQVVLQPDGSIELHPAAGRSVVVSGDLETEHLRYRPAGGGPRQTLT